MATYTRRLWPWLVLFTLIMAYRSAAQMSKKSKDQINKGLATGEAFVSALSKLGDPKVDKIFHSLGKMASFLGAAGGVISFVLLFVPQQESVELQYMKKKFGEVNTKLDRISKQLDNVADLITYENQRSVYIKSASNIIFAHSKLSAFMTDVEETPCSGTKDCGRVRLRIASKYNSYFDVRRDLFTILDGVTKATSIFGDPLLLLLRKTYKCNVAKLNHFSNGVLKLAFKAQQVIMAFEKLSGSKTSITQSMTDWLDKVYRIREYNEQQRKYCFDHVKAFISQDINDEKYQVGFPTNDKANKGLKLFLDQKYPWLDWVVYSYYALGHEVHQFMTVPGFWALPPRNNRKRVILVTPIDKKGTYGTQKDNVLKAINEIVDNHNFYRSLYNAKKILTTLVEGLKKRAMHKYIFLFNVLRTYTDLQYLSDNDHAIIVKDWKIRTWRYARVKKSGPLRFIKTNFQGETIRLVIVLKSQEELARRSCSLGCNDHGRCHTFPFSSEEYCQCKRYYQGSDCGEHTKAELAKTTDAMLHATLKIPTLWDKSLDISKLREYVGISFGDIHKSIRTVEVAITNAFNALAATLTTQFKWANLITYYAKVIQRIKYFAYRLENHQSWQGERLKIAKTILEPEGMQKLMYELNFLFTGRSGTPMVNHEPLLLLYMQKHSSLACTVAYKAIVDSTWRQLVLLQLTGHMVWSQALDIVGRSTTRIGKLYKSRLSVQMTKMKEATCQYSVPHSENINCVGRYYLHPGMTVTNKCTQTYYVTGSSTTTCKSKRSECSACNCNSAGSKKDECADFSGRCSCKDNYYGNKCSCNDACVTKYTDWKTHGPKGKVGYLALHSLKCGVNGYILKMFRLERIGEKMRYKYICCQLDHGRVCRDYLHRQNDYSETGHAGHLDRQPVDCDKNGFLNSFSMTVTNAKDRFRYDYSCCNVYKPEYLSRMKCKSHNTAYTYWGKGINYYPERQTVRCETGFYLSFFKLERNSDFDRWRYRYRCCSLCNG